MNSTHLEDVAIFSVVGIAPWMSSIDDAHESMHCLALHDVILLCSEDV